jgi:hypothetical protein
MRVGKAMVQMHKFNVGQIVQFHPNRNERFTAPGGAYEITKRLPHNGQEYEYRIKSPQEGHERTARESQLTSAEAGHPPPAEPPKPQRRPAKRKDEPR